MSEAGEKTTHRRRQGAADLCRTFLENEGWTQIFSIARGDPQRQIIRSKISGKAIEIKISPDIETRLTAYKHITAYGYGRPAELAHADDSGRTVTDLILAALRPQGIPEEGPR